MPAVSIRNLSAVLSGLGNEIGTLMRIAEELQPVLVLAWSNHDADPRLSHTIQQSDLLTQKLGALADIMNDLSRVTPPGWQVDVGAAVDNVQLAELAATLSCVSSPRSHHPQGEVELF